MSNGLAIAAITKALKLQLDNIKVGDADIGDLKVTTKPPDRAREPKNPCQLNIFLYQTTVNTGWSNVDPAGMGGGGGRPPLALDLQYLLTAYGKDDEDVLAHHVLGKAMHVLHDRPMLSRAQLASALPGTDIEHQVERIRISPHAVSIDGLSKLWTTFQTGYRISAGYSVSVVLIDSRRPRSVAMPVLTRGPADRGVTAEAGLEPPVPRLDEVVPEGGQLGVEIGQLALLRGRRLIGDVVTAELRSRRVDGKKRLPVEPGGLSTERTVRIAPDAPGTPADQRWACGTYELILEVELAGEPTVRTLGRPVTIIPRLDAIAATPLAGGTTEVSVTIEPAAKAGQSVALLIDGRELYADTPDAPEASFTFEIEAIDAGTYPVRVRVDQAVSRLVDRQATPPEVLPAREVVIA